MSMRFKIQHGRIHGYPSRMRVGRGIDAKTAWKRPTKYFARSSDAKTAQKRRKSLTVRMTDGPTDVACTSVKRPKRTEEVKMAKVIKPITMQKEEPRTKGKKNLCDKWYQELETLKLSNWVFRQLDNDLIAKENYFSPLKYIKLKKKQSREKWNEFIYMTNMRRIASEASS